MPRFEIKDCINSTDPTTITIVTIAGIQTRSKNNNKNTKSFKNLPEQYVQHFTKI